MDKLDKYDMLLDEKVWGAYTNKELLYPSTATTQLELGYTYLEGSDGLFATGVATFGGVKPAPYPLDHHLHPPAVVHGQGMMALIPPGGKPMSCRDMELDPCDIVPNPNGPLCCKSNEPAMLCFNDDRCDGVLVDATGKYLISYLSNPLNPMGSAITHPTRPAFYNDTSHKQTIFTLKRNRRQMCNDPETTGPYAYACIKRCMKADNQGTCDDFMKDLCARDITNHWQHPECQCINHPTGNIYIGNPKCYDPGCATDGYGTVGMLHMCSGVEIKTDSPTTVKKNYSIFNQFQSYIVVAILLVSAIFICGTVWWGFRKLTSGTAPQRYNSYKNMLNSRGTQTNVPYPRH